MLLKIVYILRKDGKIVYSDYTYLTSIDPGANLAFETPTFSAPEHDSIECFGTNVIPEGDIIRIIKDSFDLTPKGIINYLELKKPIFSKTTNYGHFGRDGFSWEEVKQI